MFRYRQFQSESVRARYRRLFVWRLCLVIAIVIVLILGVREVSSMHQLAWRAVRVAGHEYVSPRDVYELVTPLFDGRRWGIIDGKNRFFFNDAKAAEVIQDALPRAASVKVESKNRELVITLIEREAVAVSCPIDSFSGCFYVDSTGYQFAPAELRGNLFVYHTEPRLRDYVRPTDEFVYFSSMRERLGQLGLHAISLTLLSDEMSLLLRNGTRVRFGIDGHERQFANLETILNSKEYAEETGGNIAAVEYFDLRFGDRVFYKLVGGQ